MAGYRADEQRLTTSLPPWPVNPYGCGKLFGERGGRDLAARTGISFIALRIGYCQHAPGNVPGPHMELGLWGQQMWLSDRDLCHGVERAVLAEGVPFAILNLMSDNPGMRWDLDETRRVIGYAPSDGHHAIE
jgi:nucleoside-diphosphate-sugar epimerase